MYKENKIVQPRAVNNTDGKGATFFFTLPTINSSPNQHNQHHGNGQ